MMEFSTLNEADNEERLKEAVGAMVAAHYELAAMIASILQVSEKLPELSNDMLVVLWLGIEAKVSEKDQVVLKLARRRNW